MKFGSVFEDNKRNCLVYHENLNESVFVIYKKTFISKTRENICKTQHEYNLKIQNKLFK